MRISTAEDRVDELRQHLLQLDGRIEAQRQAARQAQTAGDAALLRTINERVDELQTQRAHVDGRLSIAQAQLDDLRRAHAAAAADRLLARAEDKAMRVRPALRLLGEAADEIDELAQEIVEVTEPLRHADDDGRVAQALRNVQRVVAVYREAAALYPTPAAARPAGRNGETYEHR